MLSYKTLKDHPKLRNQNNGSSSLAKRNGRYKSREPAQLQMTPRKKYFNRNKSTSNPFNHILPVLGQNKDQEEEK